MKRKSLGIALFLFVLLLLQMILFSPEELELRDPNEFLKVGQWDDSIQQNMQGILLVESEAGRKIWEITADRALALTESNSWEMEKVSAKFLSDTGDDYEIQADKSFYETSSKNMMFSGQIKVISSTGHVFETTKLFFASEKRSLSGDAPVEFRDTEKEAKSKMKLRSSEIAIDLATGLAQLLGNVESEKFEEGNQNFSFTSGSFLFEEANSKARLEDNVVIRYEDMTITGSEAVLEYSPKTNVLERVLMEKGASLDSKSKKAVAGKLIIDIAKESIILEQEPRLIQGGDELLGDQFVFRNKGKELEVKGAKAHLTNSNSGTVLDE